AEEEGEIFGEGGGLRRAAGDRASDAGEGLGGLGTGDRLQWVDAEVDVIERGRPRDAPEQTRPAAKRASGGGDLRIRDAGERRVGGGNGAGGDAVPAERAVGVQARGTQSTGEDGAETAGADHDDARVCGAERGD